MGGACAMGTDTIALIQICQIQAIMTVPSSTNTIFLCKAVKLQSRHMSGRQKPLLTLETIQQLRFPFAFWTFWVLRIVGYRSGILRLEFLVFLSAIRIDKNIGKTGYWVSRLRFPVALQGFGISWPIPVEITQEDLCHQFVVTTENLFVP